MCYLSVYLCCVLLLVCVACSMLCCIYHLFMCVIYLCCILWLVCVARSIFLNVVFIIYICVLSICVAFCCLYVLRVLYFSILYLSPVYVLSLCVALLTSPCIAGVASNAADARRDEEARCEELHRPGQSTHWLSGPFIPLHWHLLPPPPPPSPHPQRPSGSPHTRSLPSRAMHPPLVVLC